VDLSNDLAIMKAGASIAVYQNAITAYNVSVNERNLQIELCVYNKARPEESRVDRKTLLTAFYSKIHTGKDESNLVWHYVNWCSGSVGLIDQHMAALHEVLIDYRKQHPECPYSRLENLSADQIIELDKKFEDPDFMLVLDW